MSTAPTVASSHGQAESRRPRHPLPEVEEVRPGLWSIPVPWPGSPLRYTLAYLVSRGQDVALIDTGWPTEQGWDALVAGTRQAGHDVRDIGYVLVTHAHPDHLGMADKVRELSGARIGMHPAEAAALRQASPARLGAESASWLRSRGAPRDEAAQIQGLIAEAIAQRTTLAAPDFLIEHASRPLRGLALRAVWTPGHTPGHLCFHHEDHDVLLTGDHVLPRISPHIAQAPGDNGDPLGSYLASLSGLTDHEPAEVLPAHEYRFAGLAARVTGLLTHHRMRLAEIEHVVARRPGLSTWQVAEVLDWSRGWEHTHGMARRAAVAETLAHLVHLAGQARVVNAGGEIDAWSPGRRAPGRYP
jgi:glyoxylase-like metal-dependent hydrolase (beta-lactamase superfamily II)